MGTGLRVGDGRRLAQDCIIHDGQGAPYLFYTNHQMRRDAFVPIDTGRVRELANLDRLVDGIDGAAAPGVVVVSAISGAAGRSRAVAQRSQLASLLIGCRQPEQVRPDAGAVRSIR